MGCHAVERHGAADRSVSHDARACVEVDRGVSQRKSARAHIQVALLAGCGAAAVEIHHSGRGNLNVIRREPAECVVQARTSHRTVAGDPRVGGDGCVAVESDTGISLESWSSAPVSVSVPKPSAPALPVARRMPAVMREPAGESACSAENQCACASLVQALRPAFADRAADRQRVSRHIDVAACLELQTQWVRSGGIGARPLNGVGEIADSIDERNARAASATEDEQHVLRDAVIVQRHIRGAVESQILNLGGMRRAESPRRTADIHKTRGRKDRMVTHPRKRCQTPYLRKNWSLPTHPRCNSRTFAGESVGCGASTGGREQEEML